MPKLCVIEGDGIGHEVVPAAVQVLQTALPELEIVKADAGWDYFLQHGVSVPHSTIQAVRTCGAALFGAVSSPSHPVKGYKSAILCLRQACNLFANLRPVRSLPRISPRMGIDLLIVRENTEGLYSGREKQEGDIAIAERVITRQASLQIARKTIEIAKANGRKKLTIVHKANILPLTDGLFRDAVRSVIDEANLENTNYEIEELLVDTAALKLVETPEKFDVLVTTNLFGDILSDIAAFWCGGIGFAPALNWGAQFAIAEPVHGSAPDIAGKGIANPIAAILSSALLARHVWKLPAIANQIETAVNLAMEQDIAIRDKRILPEETTKTITQAIINHLYSGERKNES